ncbi:MAG: hypothetical protein IK122_01440, partial [Alphaproteobacteria bacterium]|nr:hypothetical protein [Alphaproteobacteria bacterium]
DITVSGIAACSSETPAHATLSTASFTPSGTGGGCWCKITSPAAGGKWIFASNQSAQCSNKCSFICANNMKGTATKNITYRTNIYTSAGIATTQ